MVDADDGGLKPGDLCHHGQNALPAYRVVWVDSGKVWLRDLSTGQDAVVEASQCRRMDEPPGEPPSPTPITWPDGTPRP